MQHMHQVTPCRSGTLVDWGQRLMFMLLRSQLKTIMQLRAGAEKDLPEVLIVDYSTDIELVAFVVRLGFMLLRTYVWLA